jgi:hypothetical protein
LAMYFHVDRRAISDIRDMKTYRHISPAAKARPPYRNYPKDFDRSRVGGGPSQV